MLPWPELLAALADRGLDVRSETRPTPVGGGDISAAWRIETDNGPVFLKTGHSGELAMLQAEAEGLAELAAARAIRVPAVLAVGECGDSSYLALEWLNLGPASRATERMLGEQLAALHRHSRDKLGWHRDNFIGRTPQRNAYCDDWISFYAEHRLGFQLELAAQNGHGGELQLLGARLVGRMPDYFDVQPAPSLLHGDLWAGNCSACDGEPVIYDPAVYYGDRETDLAMTRLFGGFGSDFYDAYDAAWPLPPGHERRVALYQLYHVLNHLNLFGAGYLGKAVSLMKRLLG
jgi:fructosamine-3-kinase